MQIFDMDGTLIDSNGIWKDVDTAFLAKRGLPYTKEYYEGVAHTIFPLAARFTKEFCHLPESEEAIMAEWMDMAGDLYGTSVPVKPCLLYTSHTISPPSSRRWRRWCCSSCRRSWTRWWRCTPSSSP